jgi:oligopeptide/dipeptide ABC transporter ATP-binding protein
MIGKPSIVVLDEAVSSLDVILQNDIVSLLLDLQRENGVAYIFISHDMKVVLDVSDRIMVMYLGRIVESIEREALTRDGFLHPYAVLLESAQPRPPAAGESPTIVVGGSGDPATSDVQWAGCRFADRCPLADDRCRSEEPELRGHGPGHAVACYHAGELEGLAV